MSEKYRIIDQYYERNVCEFKVLKFKLIEYRGKVFY